jgi:hypothetical protein
MAALLLYAWLPLSSSAQGITTPRAASPAAKISQTIGLSTVTVSYSRPAVKGREVWGKLVPYGWNVQPFGAQNKAPWRAGANENTTIEFSHEANFQGTPVPAGTYGLFFVIHADNTGEVVLSKEYRAWGSFWYDASEDLMRAPVQIRDIQHTEILTYDFFKVDRNSAELVLSWEKKEFPVTVTFAVNDIVLANAMEELKGPIGFNWQGYSSAANYTLQNKVSPQQGITWIDQAIARNRSFATLQIKSGLLRELGQAEDAEKIMAEAMGIALESELNNYGYQLLGQSQNEKAIEIFKVMTDRYPKSPNAWDSLGEGYALHGDQKNAITCFKKSLKMNPPANVKINSEKYLKQFGAL